MADEPVFGDLYRQVMALNEVSGLLEHLVAVVLGESCTLGINNWLE